MKTLYADRQLFLKALRSTDSTASGLCAVVYLLWRYVNYQRLLKGETLSRKLRIPVVEILYRCWVVSWTNQHPAFTQMYSWDRDLWPAWDEGLNTVDPQDSRQLVQAFTDHFDPASEVKLFNSVTVPFLDIPNALSFLLPRIVPDSEELLGFFIAELIERLWHAVIHRESTSELLIQVIGISLRWLGKVLKQLHHTWETNPAPLMRIAHAMASGDLLQLIEMHPI
ncbi:hypothetical protein FRC11_009576 [Ceratobasidium sp. 423]|nr:hypothetical protein FRC11_009576 [Ceratobasidium sp. 423]